MYKIECLFYNKMIIKFLLYFILLYVVFVYVGYKEKGIVDFFWSF